MAIPVKFLFPPRTLGQINGKSPSFASRVFGYPGGRRPVYGGGVQVDGYQSDIVTLETYTSPFGNFIQVDGLQTIIVAQGTDLTPFSDTIQLDGFQAVIISK